MEHVAHAAGIQVAEEQLGHDGSVNQVHHRHDGHHIRHMIGEIEPLVNTAVAVDQQNTHHQAQGIHTPNRGKPQKILLKNRLIKAGCP